MPTPTTIESKFDGVTEYESPKVISRVSDQFVKIARLKGQFVWHTHDPEDDLLLVIRGQLRIQLGHGEVEAW